jgi:hypothetical protein
MQSGVNAIKRTGDYKFHIWRSHVYNQKSENIEFEGLAEVINKLIFNNLHNPPTTKYFDIIINPLYSKQLLNLVLVEDCGFQVMKFISK